MPKKGYKHPNGCICGVHFRPGHPHTEEHKKYMSVRIKEARAENDWLIGRKHPADCKHCAAINGQNNYAIKRGSPHKNKTYEEIYGDVEAKLQKQNRSEQKRGAKNPNWTGGESLTRGDDWNEKRKLCLERDGLKCRDCGVSEVKISVHHMIPFRICKHNELENLIALCAGCHTKWDRNFNRTGKSIPKWYLEGRI